MRRLILATLVIALIPGFAAAADIAGDYACKGTNPGTESPYSDTVKIAKNGNVFNVHWKIAGQEYQGVGLLTADGKHFSVGYTASKDWFGVVVYEISGNTLKGKWTGMGSNAYGTETLTKK